MYTLDDVPDYIRQALALDSILDSRIDPPEKYCLVYAKMKAHDHWEFVNEMLLLHDINKSVVKIIEFYYKNAFVHGYQHGVDDTK